MISFLRQPTAITTSSLQFMTKLASGLALLAGLFLFPPQATADANLIEASQAGDLPRVQSLIAKKVNVNSKESDGTTALIVASARGHADIVQALLRAKADIKATDANGYTSLLLASDKGHATIVQALLDAGADPDSSTTMERATALMLAVRHGYRDVLSLLIAVHANVNKRGYCGFTPLIWASNNGFIDVVRTLIEQKADVDVKACGGVTALIAATRQGHNEVVRALLAAGADVNIKMDDGRTPLDEAITFHHDDTRLELVSAGGVRSDQSTHESNERLPCSADSMKANGVAITFANGSKTASGPFDDDIVWVMGNAAMGVYLTLNGPVAAEELMPAGPKFVWAFNSVSASRRSSFEEAGLSLRPQEAFALETDGKRLVPGKTVKGFRYLCDIDLTMTVLDIKRIFLNPEAQDLSVPSYILGTGREPAPKNAAFVGIVPSQTHKSEAVASPTHRVTNKSNK